jgi:hypothetical protein
MASEQTMMQQANKLLSQYSLLYRERYGSVPKMNRFKEKYAMKDVVESVGFDRATELMSYYFKTARTSHPLDWFKYNFDKLDTIMEELADDEAKKQKMREETARRVEEWKEKNESRSKTN